MIKNVISYLSVFTLFSLGIIILIDMVIMPAYVRRGEGRYMVNVIGKSLKHSKKILSSEGYKNLVSDTLYTGQYEPGTIVDQYPTPNTRVKEEGPYALKLHTLKKWFPSPI